MNSINLYPIKAALAKILPGPWRYDASNDCVWAKKSVKPTAESNPLDRVCDASNPWALYDPTHAPLIRANLEFIAAAREWIPALVAEVEQLRAELASITAPTI